MKGKYIKYILMTNILYYSYEKWAVNVAGLKPSKKLMIIYLFIYLYFYNYIVSVDGVENVDLSSMISKVRLK